MSEVLHRIVYRSLSCIDHDEALGLDEIFWTSVRNNKRGGITGALALVDKRFVQVLEGSPLNLARVMDRIKADKRHREIMRLGEWNVSARLFSGWAMAKPDMSPIDSQSLRIAAKDGSGAQVTGLMAALLNQPDQLFRI